MLAILAFGVSGTASANFTGIYDVSNWSVLNNAGGAVDLAAAPLSITLTSGNQNIAGDTLFTTVATQAATINFDWSYVTNDLWGESGADAFGYVINGVFSSLTDPNQDVSIPNQSGSASFAVNAGDVFGFDANTFDGYYGSSVTVVSNFNASPAAVPVPAAFWLFGSAVAGFGAFLRRHKA